MSRSDLVPTRQDREALTRVTATCPEINLFRRHDDTYPTNTWFTGPGIEPGTLVRLPNRLPWWKRWLGLRGTT